MTPFATAGPVCTTSTTGARALLNFIQHSEMDGIEVTIEQISPRIEDQLTALADDEQRDKLKTILESV